jgi:hypothetical protein
MESIRATITIFIIILFMAVGFQIVRFYLIGETLKAVFWLLVLILLIGNRPDK